MSFFVVVLVCWPSGWRRGLIDSVLHPVPCRMPCQGFGRLRTVRHKIDRFRGLSETCAFEPRRACDSFQTLPSPSSASSASAEADDVLAARRHGSHSPDMVLVRIPQRRRSIRPAAALAMPANAPSRRDMGYPRRKVRGAIWGHPRLRRCPARRAVCRYWATEGTRRQASSSSVGRGAQCAWLLGNGVGYAVASGGRDRRTKRRSCGRLGEGVSGPPTFALAQCFPAPVSRRFPVRMRASHIVERERAIAHERGPTVWWDPSHIQSPMDSIAI